MIALYSNRTRIALQAGVHYHAKPTVYTVVNDFTTVMKQLPNFVTLHSFAILRHHTSQRVKQYQFRPKKVKDALVWLIKNNRQYENVIPSLPSHVDWYSESELNIECLDDIILDEEEVTELGANAPDVDTSSSPATNSGARDGEQEVLLMLDGAHDDLQASTLFEAAHNRPVVDRGSHHRFVDPFNNRSFYWERLFPTLFPYGRGGPSDNGNQHSDISTFAKHVLERGGTVHGRRFQQSSSFIFTAYAFDARKRIGGFQNQKEREKRSRSFQKRTARK